MMCHKIGIPPISTIGLGFKYVSSLKRVPLPPAKITAFIQYISPCSSDSNPGANLQLSGKPHKYDREILRYAKQAVHTWFFLHSVQHYLRRKQGNPLLNPKRLFYILLPAAT